MVGSFFTQEPVLRNASSRTDVPKLSVNVCTSKTDNLATSGALWKRPMRASASMVNFWINSVLALKMYIVLSIWVDAGYLLCFPLCQCVVVPTVEVRFKRTKALASGFDDLRMLLENLIYKSLNKPVALVVD
jgi:hypothetical protein